jgi:hypothetical protein
MITRMSRLLSDSPAELELRQLKVTVRVRVTSSLSLGDSESNSDSVVPGSALSDSQPHPSQLARRRGSISDDHHRVESVTVTVPVTRSLWLSVGSESESSQPEAAESLTRRPPRPLAP